MLHAHSSVMKPNKSRLCTWCRFIYISPSPSWINAGLLLWGRNRSPDILWKLCIKNIYIWSIDRPRVRGGFLFIPLQAIATKKYLEPLARWVPGNSRYICLFHTSSKAQGENRNRLRFSETLFKALQTVSLQGYENHHNKAFSHNLLSIITSVLQGFGGGRNEKCKWRLPLFSEKCLSTKEGSQMYSNAATQARWKRAKAQGQ